MRNGRRERSVWNDGPWIGDVMAPLQGRGLEQGMDRSAKGKEEVQRRIGGVLRRFVPVAAGLSREQWAERVMEAWF
jgi:hypothetical protein